MSKVNFLLRSFTDTGTVYYENTSDDGKDSDNITSAGIGLTAQFGGKYFLDMQWATPIDGNDTGDGLGAPFWLTIMLMF